jgi:hypothetical protein
MLSTVGVTVPGSSRSADTGEIPARHNLLRFHLPEREIMTGIGPVAVRCPRVRDRAGEGPERIRFSSAILPPYARRSKSLEVRSRSSLGVLMLRCPTTGRGFATGVNTDEATFRRLPDTLGTAHCPHCGQEHWW